jgi:hypothetical protein
MTQIRWRKYDTVLAVVCFVAAYGISRLRGEEVATALRHGIAAAAVFVATIAVVTFTTKGEGRKGS